MLVRSAVLFLLLGDSLAAASKERVNIDKKKQQSVEKRIDNGSSPQKRGLYDPVEILNATPLPSFASYHSPTPYPEVVIKPSSTAIPHPLPLPYEGIHNNFAGSGSSLPPIVSSTPLPSHSVSLHPPVKEITVTKEVPVPYYVHVEKRIPYPVYIQVPHPYPVTVEKHVPYEVRVPVEHPVPVPVPRPYPVHVEKHIPVPVERRIPIPYPVKVPVDRPYPVHVPVEKPVPYPVQVLVDRPVPVPKPYPVPVEKHIPYPYPVKVPVPVDRPVPTPYDSHYHYQEESQPQPSVKPYQSYYHGAKYVWPPIFKRNAHH